MRRCRPDAVYFGEISLAGGVRPVVHASLRLREAQKLGFAAAVTGRLGAGDKANGLHVQEYQRAPRAHRPHRPQRRAGMRSRRVAVERCGQRHLGFATISG